MCVRVRMYKAYMDVGMSGMASLPSLIPAGFDLNLA